MSPSLFSLTNGKSFISPRKQRNRTIFFHNFTSSSKNVYIQSVRLLTLQTPSNAAVFYLYTEVSSSTLFQWKLSVCLEEWLQHEHQSNQTQNETTFYIELANISKMYVNRRWQMSRIGMKDCVLCHTVSWVTYISHKGIWMFRPFTSQCFPIWRVNLQTLYHISVILNVKCKYDSTTLSWTVTSIYTRLNSKHRRTLKWRKRSTDRVQCFTAFDWHSSKASY